MTTSQPENFGGLGRTLDAMREGLQAIDRQWRYLYLNQAAAAHGRRPREELLGRTMMECYPGIENTEVFALMSRCMAERAPGRMENKFVYPDATSRTFELRIEPTDSGIVVLSIDVTENRKLEDQLRQAQKMEAVGRLAGGVAHDFNNMLSVIISYGELLRDGTARGSADREPLDEIVKAAERAGTLTRQLLAFSRQQVLEPRVIDLNAVVTEMSKMLQRLIGEDVRLELSLGRSLGRIHADPGQVEQIIANLVVNARDAMPSGGRLIIETTNADLDEEYARGHADVRPGPHAILAVTDTGVGMDASTQARIFEPFFTTKELGKGTGLGLSMVYGVVKQSGGHIWVYSELGRGTSFKLYFPHASATEAERRPSERLRAPPGQVGTILLVEDEDMVRGAARAILRGQGYVVLEASGLEEALQTCEAHEGPIDLLLTDMVLPGADGLELSERVRAKRPEIAHVLYMSGYTELAVTRQGLLTADLMYLQKPFTRLTLTEKVAEALAGGPKE